MLKLYHYSPGSEAFGLHCHLDQARFSWCRTCWSSCSLQEQKEVNWIMFVRTYWSIILHMIHTYHICNVEYVTEVEKVFLLEEAGMDFQLSKQWKKLSFDAWIPLHCFLTEISTQWADYLKHRPATVSPMICSS